MLASSRLFNIPLTFPPLLYLPFVNILENFCGSPHGAPFAAGKETILDAALIVGFITSQNIVWANDALPHTSRESKFGLPCFYELSNLILKAPSPILRSQACTLTSIFFHSHPSDRLKYKYVQSILGYPDHDYETLKPSVVGWLKDEMLASANGISSTEEFPVEYKFANPSTLFALRKELFSIPHNTELLTEFHEHLRYFQVQIPFFLAVLNLFYLLCSSQLMYDRIYSRKLEDALDVIEPITLWFIAPLKGITQRVMSVLSKWATSSDSESEGSAKGMLELVLLDDTIDRAFKAFDVFKARATA